MLHATSIWYESKIVGDLQDRTMPGALLSARSRCLKTILVIMMGMMIIPILRGIIRV